MALIALKPRGAQADTPPAGALSIGFAHRLRNMMYRRGRYIRRMGCQSIHSVLAGEAIHGIWALKESPTSGATVYTNFAGLAGSTTATPYITKLIAGALNVLPYNGVTIELSYVRSHEPYRPAAINNLAGYVVRRGLSDKDGNGVFRYDKNNVTLAGCAAPTAAPTITDPGGGSLPDGVFAACSYCFETADGLRSNASPVASVTTASGGTGTRRWSGLEAAPNPRYTFWTFFVPRAGANNLIAYEAITAPISGTTYDETVAETALGVSVAPTRNLPPPVYPEDFTIWAELAWVTTNDPNAGWRFSYIDENGTPQWEAFDEDTRVLRLPPRGGKRAMAAIPWDGQGIQRLALFTDSSLDVATPGAEVDVFNLETLDENHGIPTAAAACAAKGILFFYDGKEVRISEGGPPEVISYGWVQKALAAIPDAYVDRVRVSYRQAEGGFFCISFPSTAASTHNDLELWWSPQDGWNEADYLRTGGVAVAPTCYGTVVPGCPTRIGDAPRSIDLCSFYGQNRIHWLDSPALRDEGPYEVHCRMELAHPVDPDGMFYVCSGFMFGVEQRRDIAATSTKVVVFDASLLLDGITATTPKACSRTLTNQYVHAPAGSLGRRANIIQPVLEFDAEAAIEIFDMHVDLAQVGQGWRA